MLGSITNIDFDAATGAITSQQTNKTYNLFPGSLSIFGVMTRLGNSLENNAPIITGCNIPWRKIQEIYFDTTTTSRKKLSLFAAYAKNAQAGKLTLDFSGQTQSDIIWSHEQVLNPLIRDNDNPLSAIAQVSIFKDEVSNGGPISANLPTKPDKNSILYGLMSSDGVGAGPSVGSGFNILSRSIDKPVGGSVQEFLTECKLQTTDPTVNATFSSAAGAAMGAIGIEISIAYSGPKTLPILGSG
jgi:hypothetical protein